MGERTGNQSQVQLGLLSRRPAVWGALFLIAGILLHSVLNDAPRAWAGMAFGCAAAALGLRRLAALSTAALGIALICLGIAAAQLEHFHFPPDDIAAYTSAAPALAEMEMVIDQPPRVLHGPSSGGRVLPPRQVAGAHVRRIRTLAGWRDCGGEILLQLSPPMDELKYGQRIAALGTLSQPPPADNPGQFDWRGYYRKQRILASLDVNPSQTVRILESGGFSPLHWLRAKARWALEKGFSPDQGTDHALLRALVLGDSDPRLRDIQADFIRTGTSHHLSISGMHVAIMGGVMFFFCRLIRLPPRVSALVMMGFVVLYGLAALPAPPVIRSIILCLSLGVGILLRRSGDGIQLLALTIFIMLLIHPLDLYSAGFQLSFGTVLGLMLYAKGLIRRLDRRNEDERVLMELGIAPSGARSIRNGLKRRLIEAVAAALVAWAVSAPLLVEHFDQVNPWSIPAGILLAIPVFLSLVGGLFKIVLTCLLPWLAPLWAWLAALPVEAMRLGVSGLAKIPGSDLPLPAVPLVMVAAYYLFILLPLLPLARARWRWAIRGGAAAACLCAALLPLLVGLAPRHTGQLKVTLLSVGAGQCAIVELPSGKTILIDAGSSTLTDPRRQCLEPFLRREGIRRIDAAYISHANLDHFSAIAPAAETYHIPRVHITPQFRRHAARNPLARAMLRRLEALGCAIQTVTAGQTIAIDDDCALKILWPTENPTLDANNSCQVMQLAYKGRTILFTGDIQSPAEAALLADRGMLKSDVLIAPHHGSREETTEKFVDAVDPRWVLASSDRTLSGKQRAFDSLNAHRRLIRTYLSGAITLTISADGSLDVSTFHKR